MRRLLLNPNTPQTYTNQINSKSKNPVKPSPLKSHSITSLLAINHPRKVLGPSHLDTLISCSCLDNLFDPERVCQSCNRNTQQAFWNLDGPMYATRRGGILSIVDVIFIKTPNQHRKLCTHFMWDEPVCCAIEFATASNHVVVFQHRRLCASTRCCKA